jgi:hypothetical protein
MYISQFDAAYHLSRWAISGWSFDGQHQEQFSSQV